MKEELFLFSNKSYPCYFDGDFNQLATILDKEQAVIITDENIAALYEERLDGWKKIVISPGENNKQQFTVDSIIQQLIKLKADRQTFIVGLGGGVITDLTGYVASVYMRGVKFGFIPTSILAMVDAAVGGKNGVDVGIYKNLVGVIRHPEFLLFDYSFLQSLPIEEWVNGFAEIIKHACIKDKELFKELQENSLSYYQSNKEAIASLIRRNVEIKYKIVASDEFETGDRKLLNFGHTIGHAIENKHSLAHGHAVSVGMVAACKISEQFEDFQYTNEVIQLISQYKLTTHFDYTHKEIWDILLMDKKKSGNMMNFILLKDIGNALIQKIPLTELENILEKLN